MYFRGSFSIWKTGRWARGSKTLERVDESVADGDEMSRNQERVIPYVDDTKNCLIFTPARMLLTNPPWQPSRLHSRGAIQIKYQLEDSETCRRTSSFEE